MQQKTMPINMKYLLNTTYSLLLIVLFFTKTIAQPKSNSISKPKLVVGIVVDQMRYDFLYRFQAKYGTGGFNRLLRKGFNCKNMHYNYGPTVTAAGHSAIFTGSVPAINGIVGNDWYDRRLGRSVYCAADSTVQSVGSGSSAGRMSARNLLASTIADQLRITQVFKNKSIGISLKDRGAIMPAGHTATGAYWFDNSIGGWVTSTYYMKQLPAWAQKYNEQQEAKKYLNTTWNTLLPIEKYTEAEGDSQAYEGKLPGENEATFPHQLTGTNAAIYETLKSTPFGSTMTKDFALAAIDGENLGGNGTTDFLSVSFSSPDYAGHAFGPYSVEVEDIYLRLDRDLESLLSHLDRKLGRGNYLFFLSADHAVADIPAFWQKNKLPAGVKDYGFSSIIKNAITKNVGDAALFLAFENSQIYLNQPLMQAKNMTSTDVLMAIKPSLMAIDGVADVLDLQYISTSTLPSLLKERIANGYNAQRSGDLMVLLQPQWILGRSTGTTHGSIYNYDTHVPAIFYGWGVPRGASSSAYNITDIAPTVTGLLQIMEGSGNIGNPIQFK
jgi:predicted AlkP superfamily pyrophosphatase or phosphodiesterase